MGKMADISGLISYKINDIENYIMPQIDYQIHNVAQYVKIIHSNQF